MPNVPYNPVPNIEPLPGTGSQGISVNVPGEAFGTGVAAAVRSVGGDISQGGNELFARAEAIQQLQNETSAKQADADFMMQSTQTHADFTMKQGVAANGDALAAHNQSLNDLRMKIRESLPNDMARKMYDASSLSTLSRNVFNAGLHSAQQTRIGAMNASKARVDALKDLTLSNPKDDVAFQDNLRRTMDEIDQQGDSGLGGWSQDEKDQQKGQAASALWSQRVVGLARTDPFRAKAVMEEAFDKHLIRGQDMAAVQKQVNGQLATVGARNVSDAVNAGFAPYMHQRDMDRFAGVEESLTNIFKQAQRDHPELTFSISSGRRTQEEQDRLYAQGRTTPGPIVTQTRHSNHIEGRAIDIEPMGGTTSAQVEAAMKEASAKLGIPLGPEHDAIKGWDPNHYSLPREYDVGTAPKIPPEPLQSRINRAAAYTAKLDGMEDTGLTDATRARVEGDFTHAQAIKRDFDYTNVNTIDGALVGAEGGKIPTTPEELIALGPKYAQAWDQLDDVHRLQMIKKLATASKQDTSWDAQGVGLRRYQTLKEMANSNDGLQQFLDTDLVSEKNMPNSAKKELINLKVQRLRVASTDPKMPHAMQVMEGEMRQAGLDPDKKDENYWHFRSVLSGMIEQHQMVHNRPPSDKEITEYGNLALLNTHTGWGPGGRWGSPLLYEVPDKAREEIRNDPEVRASVGGPFGPREPTEDEISHIYGTKIFRDLYEDQQVKTQRASR